MIHGNLYNYNELQDDDVLKTILSIAETTIDVPSGYYFEYGALSAEIQLAEAFISSTRFAHCETPPFNIFHSHFYVIATRPR